MAPVWFTASTISLRSIPGLNKNILLLGSLIPSSAFWIATVWPWSANGLAWLTSLVADTVTVIGPCVTAAAVTRTFLLITTVPVRLLTTTFADGSPGLTSRFSIRDKNDTREFGSSGARTATETPSIAFAVPSPNTVFTLSTISLAVVKSPVRTFKTICCERLNGDSTIRSTDAPFGIRPAVGTPIVISSPAAFTSTPVDVRAPWARAYTSPSTPRSRVRIRVPPRSDSAAPIVDTFTSIV